MYILINRDNVYIKRKLKDINKKLKAEFNKEDFKAYNNNYIINVTDEDLNYKRDLYEMENVFVQKLYKKDMSNLINYGFYVVIMIMILITMTSVSGVSAMLSELIKHIPK